MIAKIVLTFLAVIALLGMFGRFKVPGQKHLARLRRGRLGAAKCRSCGAPLIGKGPCPCTGGARRSKRG